MAVVSSGRKTKSGKTIFKASPRKPTTRANAPSRQRSSGGTSSPSRVVAGRRLSEQQFQQLQEQKERTLTVTGRTEGGGTITVSRTGIVTERDRQGKLIRQFQADPKKAQEIVQQESPRIERSIKFQRERAESIKQQESTKREFRSKAEEFERQRSLRGQPTLQEPSAISTRESTRERIDRAVFGLLPGGITPTEATEEIRKAPPTIKNIPQKVFISRSTPLTYLSFRKDLSGFLSKQVKKVVPSKEVSLERQEEKFRRAEQLEAEGELELPTGFGLLNPLSEEAQIGRTVIEAVKSGQTLEEFQARGKSQKGLNIVLSGTDVVREKPLELVEVGAQIVFTGKGLATIGQKGVTLGTTGLAKLGITSRASKFLLLEAPILFAESEAMGFVTEKFAKSRDFTERQAEDIAFASRILQAESFANILGSSEVSRIPQIVNPKGIQRLTSFGVAFKSKVIPGAIEGLLSTEATFDRIGEQEILGITFGSKQLLPSKDVEIIPGIDTLKGDKFPTITREVTRAEFEKASAELKEKQITTENLEDFENILFKISDKGIVTEEALFSLKTEETEVTKFRAGKIITDITGAGLGSISAGLFGGFEDIFKGTAVGRTTTAGIGFSIDLPELPGDIVTPIFTPFGTTGIAPTTVFTPTKEAITGVTFSFKGGKDITFTKVLDVVKAPFSSKKAQARLPTFDFEKSEREFTKDLVTTQTRELTKIEGVRSLLPATVNVPTPIKSTSPTALAQRTFDLTQVTMPVTTEVTTDVAPIEDIPSDVRADQITEVASRVSTSVSQISTVFTPKLFLFPPDIDFSGGLGRRRRRKALKTNILALLPDFTSRAIGLKPQVFKTPREALRELRTLKTGFEIRRGGIIVSKSTAKKKRKPKVDNLKNILRNIENLERQPIKTPPLFNINKLLPKINTRTSRQTNVLKDINKILKKIGG